VSLRVFMQFGVYQFCGNGVPSPAKSVGAQSAQR
jgi:hypothetical protein